VDGFYPTGIFPSDIFLIFWPWMSLTIGDICAQHPPSGMQVPLEVHAQLDQQQIVPELLLSQQQQR
jgi:hypothetical protein